MPLPTVTTGLSAALYDRLMAPVERAGMDRRRRSLLSRARGTVLDVGAGTGSNVDHYAGVDRVVALEPTGGFRRRLERRAGAARVPVEVVGAGIDDAALAEGSFDTVVCTLVLCTVPDPGAALDRIRRLLKPDGTLLFLEHIAAAGGPARPAQAVVDRVWHVVAGGCRVRRDTVAAIRQAGFVITDLDRFSMRHSWPVLATCAEGVARPRSAFALPTTEETD